VVWRLEAVLVGVVVQVEEGIVGIEVPEFSGFQSV
jgi:hypothetical protein